MNQTWQALGTMLTHLGPERVWRPVTDADGCLIHKGCGHMEDSLSDPSGIDFKGKTVADLGSNLGYFAFQAHGEGAVLVHGYDQEPEVVGAATLLACLRQNTAVSFFCRDICQPPPRQYDIAMLMDFIGKGIVATGKLTRILDGLSGFSDSMLVLSARRYYRIRNDLGVDAKQMAGFYGWEEIRENRFYLSDHIIRYFSDQWQVLPLTDRDLDKPDHTKVILRFIAHEK